MYSERKALAPLSGLILQEGLLLSDIKNHPATLTAYIEILEETGLPENAVTCIHPNRVIDYLKTSTMWVLALQELKKEDANTEINGVVIKDSEWLIPITLITPCMECRQFQGKACKCVKDRARKHANKKR